MINYLNLTDFIAIGEDVCKEFKPNLKNNRADISKTMVAFANDLNWVGGGFVYIGLESDGRPRALVENFDDVQQSIANICRNQISPPLSPLIKKIDFRGEDIIEIKVYKLLSIDKYFFCLKNIKFIFALLAFFRNCASFVAIKTCL